MFEGKKNVIVQGVYGARGKALGFYGLSGALLEWRVSKKTSEERGGREKGD